MGRAALASIPTDRNPVPARKSTRWPKRSPTGPKRGLKKAVAWLTAMREVTAARGTPKPRWRTEAKGYGKRRAVLSTRRARTATVRTRARGRPFRAGDVAMAGLWAKRRRKAIDAELEPEAHRADP